MLIESGEVMLLKKMTLCGSALCLFSLNDFQIKLTQFASKDACPGLQFEANKTSSELTPFPLRYLIPRDACQIVRDRLGPCGSWVLVLAQGQVSQLSDCWPQPPGTNRVSVAFQS